MEIEIVKKIKVNVKYIHFDIPVRDGDIETVWIGSKTFVRCPVCGQKLFDLKPKNN